MSTPLQFFQYKQNQLSSGKVPLNQVAEAHGTPVYIYSENAFLAPLRELQKGLAGLDHLICFAVKANSNVAILKLLSDAGAGMDLVTGGELYRAGLAGVPSERIVFSGVGKTRDEMAAALEFSGRGIFSFNVESVPELLTLNQVATQLRKRAPVALRFNPDVDAKTHPYISTGLKKNKFGMEASEVLEIAYRLESLRGIELNGLSIHIGSQLTSFSPLNDAFVRLASMAQQLNELLPKPLSFVDLGGGVGISYKNEKIPPLERYTTLIHKHFGKKKRYGALKVLIEPGRTLSGNSGVLVTRVLYRKKRKNKDFLIVDAGMNDLMRPALYGSYHQIIPLQKPSARTKTRKFDIVGPVCESTDCFASDRSLPENVQEGDLLAILSAGAYGFTMSNNYNSRPRPAEILIQNDQPRVIRRRETYADLSRGEVL